MKLRFHLFRHRVILWSPDRAMGINYVWALDDQEWISLLNTDSIEFVTVHRSSTAFFLSIEEDLIDTSGKYKNFYWL